MRDDARLWEMPRTLTPTLSQRKGAPLSWRPSADAVAGEGGRGGRPPRAVFLGTRHGVDLRGPFGQMTLGPVVAAVLTGEHFTTAGRTVHALGLPFVEGDGKHSGFGLNAHLHLRPGQAAIS